MDTLWQIRDPDLDWYQHVFVDGEIRNAMQLPLVECPRCSDVQMSDRILPFGCPPEIREEAEALDEARSQGEGSVTVPLEKFRRYAARWEAALRRYGHEMNLLPGDAFSPRLWRVPSIPRYHFFWPSVTEVIVSERIARLFQENEVSGVSLRPVMLEKVGATEPTDEVPEILDMSDYFKQAATLDNPSQYGNFFELLISHSTRPSPDEGVTIIPGCSACGRIEDWEESIAYRKQIAFYRKKKMLPRSYALDVDVFLSHIFQMGFVISPKVYALLTEEHLRNCRVDRLTVCDDPTIRG